MSPAKFRASRICSVSAPSGERTAPSCTGPPPSVRRTSVTVVFESVASATTSAPVMAPGLGTDSTKSAVETAAALNAGLKARRTVLLLSNDAAVISGAALSCAGSRARW